MSNDQEIPTRLRVAVMRLARVLRQHGPDDGLTPTLVAALVSVERKGPLTLGELAGLEQVQPPSMTRVVARLEEAGLVAREPDPADRRVARVRLTDAGGRLLSERRSRNDAVLAKRLDALADDELGMLLAAVPVLERLAGVTA